MTTLRTSCTLRTPRPDIRAIMVTKDLVIELAVGQRWYETKHRYEVWQEGPEMLPRWVSHFRKSSVLYIWLNEDLSCFASNSQPEARLKEAEALLRESLEGVEADELSRAESWPDEVARGDLVLDLGQRIRAFLGLDSHTTGVPCDQP